jgi:hypothetical protein
VDDAHLDVEAPDAATAPAPIVPLELPVPGQAATEAEAFQKVHEHLTHPDTFAHLGAEAKKDLERLAHLLGEWRKHLL